MTATFSWSRHLRCSPGLSFVPAQCREPGVPLQAFIDRSRMVRVRQRTLAMGVVLLAGIGWGGMTLAAIRSTPAQTAEISAKLAEVAKSSAELSPTTVRR